MSIAALPTIMTVVGGAVSAVGAIQQGQAAAAQANYQAQIMENNQILAQQEAVEARRRGRVEEENVRERVAQLRARQRAAAAGTGQVTDTGTAGAIEADSAALGEVDALTARRNAEIEARMMNIRAQQFGSQAEMERLAGDNQRRAGYISAGSTVLTTAGTLAQRRMSGQKLW